MLTRELIGRLPKAELHTHLDAALRPETMIELADACGFALPTRDPVQLRRFMRVDDAANLEDYLQRFEYTIPLLQSAEAIERVSYEMVEDAARDASATWRSATAPGSAGARGSRWSGRSRRSWPAWRGASATSGS